jgi:hypothetical protein
MTKQPAYSFPAFTDYPKVDQKGKVMPDHDPEVCVPITVLSYDGNKYCRIR